MKTENCVEIGTEKREKTHYSELELAEFREIILGKIETARQDLELLTEAYTTGSNEHLDTSPTFKGLSEAREVISKEENARLAGRQEKFIQSLDNALVRIGNGTYGICVETRKLICKERLRSAPHATLSIEGKNIREAKGKNQLNGLSQNPVRKPFVGTKKK